MAVLPVDHPGTARAIAWQRADFVVAGTSGSSMFLARLSGSGALDPDFRAGNLVVPELGAFVPLAVDTFPDTRILVLGRTAQANAVVQFTRDGELDPTFGTGGVVALPGPATDTGSLLRQWDDTMLVAPRLQRLSPSGEILPSSADPNFTPPDSAAIPGIYYAQGPQFWYTNGRRDTSYIDNSALPGDATAIGVSYWDRRAFQAGSLPRGGSSTDLFVRAFLPGGQLDTTFGLQGTVQLDIGQIDAVSDIIVLYNQLLVVGSARQDTGDSDLVVVKLLNDGSLDRQFGNGGVFVSPALSPAGRVNTTAEGWLLVPGQSRSGAAAVVSIDLNAVLAHRQQAWGWNGVGQLGDGTTTDRHTATPAATLQSSRSLAAGMYHSLAVAHDGTVSAWGWNALGQLGEGTTTDRHTPVTVPGLDQVFAVSAGVYHSLALRNDGTVWAWGWNGFGQLGDGTTAERHAPVQVANLTDVVAIAAGGYHSLALRSDGSVFAWGWNALGQLGDGTLVDRHTPVQTAVAGIGSISAGMLFSASLSTAGAVSTWGWDGYGELGRLNPTQGVPGPVVMPGSGKVVGIAAGGLHALAVLDDGSVATWGWNGVGQLGNGTTTDGPTPTKVPGLAGVTSVAAGTYHSLALAMNGTASGWGWNYFGQLGDGTTVDRRTPAPVDTEDPLRALAAGGVHTLAL